MIFVIYRALDRLIKLGKIPKIESKNSLSVITIVILSLINTFSICFSILLQNNNPFVSKYLANFCALFDIFQIVHFLCFFSLCKKFKKSNLDYFYI